MGTIVEYIIYVTLSLEDGFATSMSNRGESISYSPYLRWYAPYWFSLTFQVWVE